MNTPPPFPSSPVVGTKNGLSITSLVLGIFSPVPCFIFTGIPAIVTGHIARGRAKREPQRYGGAGMALTGLILGYVSILTTFGVAIAAAIILPAMAKFKGGPAKPTDACVDHLKQINLAARIWSMDHGEKFPPNFLTMSNELVTPNVLICYRDSKHSAASDWSHFNPSKNCSYEYLTPNAKEADVMQQPVFRCPFHGNVVLGDGTVRPGTAKKRP